MSDDTQNAAGSDHEDDGMLSRIPLIEDQPLESRAAAYAQIHEELQAALEGADPQRGR
jgi:hypothetical protein